jgi:hypothetical protein
MEFDRVLFYIAGIGAGTVGAGVWLRWALIPVMLAFEFGRRAERIRQHGIAERQEEAPAR